MSAERADLLHAGDLAIVVRRASARRRQCRRRHGPRDRGWRPARWRRASLDPEQREGQPPTSKIKIDNVNRELVPKIRAALGVREYIQVLYREYLGTDLTEPAYGPIEFELRDVQMVGTSLTGTAMVRNLQNKRFPRLNKNYDYIQFPGLLPA